MPWRIWFVAIQIAALLIGLGTGPVSTVAADTQIAQAQSSNQELLAAAKAGDAGRVKILLATRVNPNTTGPNGWTPLMFAALGGHLATADALITAGAKLDTLSDDGATALIAATIRGHIEVVKLLLEKGADPSVKNQDGMTALQIAKVQGRTNVVDVLQERKAAAKKEALQRDLQGVLRELQRELNGSVVVQAGGAAFSVAREPQDFSSCDVKYKDSWWGSDSRFRGKAEYVLSLGKFDADSIAVVKNPGGDSWSVRFRSPDRLGFEIRPLENVKVREWDGETGFLRESAEQAQRLARVLRSAVSLCRVDAELRNAGR